MNELLLAVERAGRSDVARFTGQVDVVVGRAADADLVLADQPWVSRRQLAFVALEGAWHVLQLGRAASWLVRADGTTTSLLPAAPGAPGAAAAGRHYRVAAGDRVELGAGELTLVVRAALAPLGGAGAPAPPTERAAGEAIVDALPPADRAVLGALVAAWQDGRIASNRELAAATAYSASTVPDCLARLYAAFAPLPARGGHAQRSALAERALAAGFRPGE